MSAFRRGLETTNGVVTLDFTRIYTIRGTIFFVVGVAKNVRFTFRMGKRNGNWKLMESLMPPEWFMDYEDQVAKMVAENEFL